MLVQGATGVSICAMLAMLWLSLLEALMSPVAKVPRSTVAPYCRLCTQYCRLRTHRSSACSHSTVGYARNVVRSSPSRAALHLPRVCQDSFGWSLESISLFFAGFALVAAFLMFLVGHLSKLVSDRCLNSL